MLGMLKRHEVEILLKAGHPKTEVARLTGVSLCSVKRIVQEDPVIHIDDAAERGKRQIGRPSAVANFRKQVIEILQQTPDLDSLEILRRVREAGYQGGKTALHALAASLRPKPAKPLVRFDGLPGEFSQHDFGQVEVEFLNGASQRIHFFASRLKYSRLIRVSLVKDEAVESLVRHDDAVYVLEPQDKVVEHAGHKVTVQGTQAGDTIKVSSVEMAEAQEATKPK
jgi:hypothetical protein